MPLRGMREMKPSKVTAPLLCKDQEGAWPQHDPSVWGCGTDPCPDETLKHGSGEGLARLTGMNLEDMCRIYPGIEISSLGSVPNGTHFVLSSHRGIS